MLSILIPTYNYNAFPLVEELHNQAIETGIDYEIIVLDDGSTDEISLEENSKINTLKNCGFQKNKANLGRAKNLNELATKSQYKWLLFMDCDTFPKNKNFITTYIQLISENKNIVFGGIVYSKGKPSPNKILRWKYGSYREEINVLKRKKKPYKTTLTSNFLIKKEIFDGVKFEKRIEDYGYEDLVFVQRLKLLKLAIFHVDNPTYHLNYETSLVFLEKTKKALKTLNFIEDTKILETTDTKIQKSYEYVVKFRLQKVLLFIFEKSKRITQANLLSKKPLLFLFDWYKLGYFATLKSKN